LEHPKFESDKRLLDFIQCMPIIRELASVVDCKSETLGEFQQLSADQRDQRMRDRADVLIRAYKQVQYIRKQL